MGFLLDEAGNQLYDEGGKELFDEAGDPRQPPSPPDPDPIPPDPDVPEDVVIKKEPLPVWTWVLSAPPPLGLERRQLTNAYGRHVTFRLDGISDAQFSLHGSSDEALEIQELATDVIMYRRNQAGVVKKVYRGRIITETDDVTVDSHHCQFSTNDYRGMLQNRLVGSGGTAFTNETPFNIAFQLIARSQAQGGGNWGITGGTISGTDASTHTIAYDPGSDILEMITNLGHRANGAFEWEIDADLRFNTWFPARGSATGAVLDFGGIITSMRKTLTSSNFGNVVLLTGDGTTTIPVVASSPSILTDPQGRWERYVSYSDIKEQTTLNERALWTLGLISTPLPQWSINLAPGRWDADNMGLGDTVRLVARKGRLNVNALHRIAEINISINEDGLEDVLLGLVLA